jgi:peptidoglycan/LPS O-acetylase OafA/YrhL
VQSEAAYAQLFTAPSPVLHFWSLGIEEQLYLFFPLVVVAGLRLGSGSRAALAAVLGALVAASVAASLALTNAGASIDRVYYGTDTRAAELLIGGLLALWLCGRVLAARARRVVEGLGAPALLVLLGLWATLELESERLYAGGFAAYGLLSASVIAAAVQPSGLVQYLLSGNAVRWVGRISYGVYLFH